MLYQGFKEEKNKTGANPVSIAGIKGRRLVGSD